MWFMIMKRRLTTKALILVDVIMNKPKWYPYERISAVLYYLTLPFFLTARAEEAGEAHLFLLTREESETPTRAKVRPRRRNCQSAGNASGPPDCTAIDGQLALYVHWIKRKFKHRHINAKLSKHFSTLRIIRDNLFVSNSLVTKPKVTRQQKPTYIWNFEKKNQLVCSLNFAGPFKLLQGV